MSHDPISPSFAEIVRRWKKDNVIATRFRVQRARERTGDCYGITSHGAPYLTPRVGQRVELGPREFGRIVKLRVTECGPEPEARIVTEDGRIVFLFQTAMRGYSIVQQKTHADFSR